jgi:hypothetical protein
MDLLNIISGQIKLRRVGGKNGGEYAGACPWCGDGSPRKAGDPHPDRFHVWPEQGRGGTYWCRQCGKAGDAIRYLMDHDGLSFKESCASLDLDPADILPKSGNVPTGWQPRTAATPADIWQEHARKFVDYCHERLLERQVELAWLAERGIESEMIEKYRLGYNPAHAWREGESWGLKMERKPDGRLKKLWLPRGIVIPMIEADGSVHRLRIRQPDQSPRYLVVPGSGSEPLLSREAEAIFVVESELDMILLDGVAGDIVGVVAMGNDSAKPTARLYPALQQALYLGVSLDSDQPKYNPEKDGMDMPGARSSIWWTQQFPRATRVPVVGGKDPGDAYSAGVNLRTWVLAALPAYFQVKADLDAEKAMHRARLQADLAMEKAVAEEAARRDAEQIEVKNPAADDERFVDTASVAAAQGIDNGNWERTSGGAVQPADPPELNAAPQSSATLITLISGESFYVTADEAEWRRLVDSGEIVFSQNELSRLQRATATMNDAERLAAALQAIEIKKIFPSAWIRRGEAVAAGE